MNASITIADLGGVVLAGGRSRRFGSEKAVARLGDKALMDRVVGTFAGLDRIAVSARAHSKAAERARAIGADVLEDDPALPSGPLAGVLAGLAWARGLSLQALATAPCDTPLLPHDLVARLVAEIGDAPAAFAVTHGADHPLCALWRVSVETPLLRQLKQGSHPPVCAFLEEIGAAPVRFDTPLQFANANTVEALAAMEARS
jgi:molybdopterin-guanine dinucleotide biosynthesis protein A